MKSSFRSLALGLALSFGLGVALAAPSVTVSGPGTVAYGSTFAVQLGAADFTDLYAYQFDVVFNPAVFKALTVSEGAFLSSGGSTFFDGGSIDNSLGRVSFIFDTLLGPGPGPSGSGLLATLSFQEIGGVAATGLFQLQNLVALNSTLGEISASSTSLQVAAVPEPETIWLLGAGLVGLGWLRRRSVTRTLRASTEPRKSAMG